MANVEMIRAFVARVLEDGGLVDGRAEPDSDGDFQVRQGSALYWVSSGQAGDDSGLVQVFGVVLEDVPLSRKLLTAVNEINRDYLWIRCFWHEGRLVVARDLAADTLTAEALVGACAQIGRISDEQDDKFKELIGAGHTFFEGDPDDEDSVEV
ncbi:T3SS (YopN, CesT) and YbjN peptide-binding chaperone 1 [Catenulispora subtropica]|uniref:TY-Chap central domain-containing protein n=1 Tax=Catenulispora subtropica TaxID=450798 RepID=A0ABN2T032_9ACTN